MAQPFLDNDLRDMYQISPELTVWLNDKENLRYYIPARHLSAQYAYFLNGKAFASSSSSYPFPCVVKMTSSSAGDGVRICRTAEEFENAKAVFKNLSGPVMVCEFIHAVRNLGVQFGIPADPAKEIDIIGFNEQIIGKHGEYLGGMIPPDFDKPELQDLFALIKESILPKVRAKGWYGVGGLDVLVTEKGKYYFIDPNFRMTAAFVFICQVRNKQIQKSLLGFIGRFKGTEAELREKILPIAQFGTIQQLLNILSISYKDGIFCFNGALVFDKNVSKEKVAQKLLELGIESPVLVSLASS